MTLTEFLLARVAEDEARAIELRDYITGHYLPPVDEMLSTTDRLWTEYAAHEYGVVGFSVARVLAECESKRRIIKQAIEDADDWAFEYGRNRPLSYDRNDILRALVLPYADRPGFSEEWR